MHVDDKSKLLDRRHTSLHNLLPFSTEKHFFEEETVVRLPYQNIQPVGINFCGSELTFRYLFVINQLLLINKHGTCPRFLD